jgi:IclR family mhp operon transcriptional activator
MSTYRPVQAAIRALRVLKLLNRHNNIGLAELFTMSGVPKPTLVRLLETLIACGHIEHNSATGTYRVSAQTAELSAGFHGAPLLVEAGREPCVDLTRRLKWPVSLAVLDGTAMFAFLSTVPDSPVAPHRPMFTKPRGLLDSALGRAYLAFCPEAERELLTQMLKHDATQYPAQIEAQINEIVLKARHSGFATRDATGSSLKNASVAIPIRFREGILGTLGITYFGSAIRRAELLERIVAPLRETGERIEQNIARIKGNARPDAGRVSPDWEVARLGYVGNARRPITVNTRNGVSSSSVGNHPIAPCPVQLLSAADSELLPEELRMLPQTVIAVIGALEADIIRRRILPGARLLEDSLMSSYQAKRHCVRAALFELDRLGVVVKPRSRGATLRRLSARDIVSIFET